MGSPASMLGRHVQLLLALLAWFANGQNLDLRWPVVHRGPEGSMFGYTVALHTEGTTDWLLVGAPKAQTSQPNVEEGGAVYKCPTAPLSAPGDCEQIPFDTTGHTLDVNGLQVADKSNQWFGASLKSSGPNGKVVACAPRYTWFYTADMIDKEREPVGVCFVSSDNFNSFEDYSPCMTTDVKEWGFMKVTHCQAGFSVDIDRKSDLLLMGAAGSYYLQGQIYVQNLTSDDEPSSTVEQPPSFDDSYRGYSVAIGEFTGDSSIEYVVGTPRANALNGTVSIFGTSLDVIAELKGEQMTSYFGYSVVAEDVNGDGLDDVLVGAPMFSDRSAAIEQWDAGRVYIFYQQLDHSFSDPDVITGDMVGGRLGLSIASLGDVNQDGYNDIAIGAPYHGKNQTGAVYVHYGSEDGLRLNRQQILSPALLKLSDVNAFGFSLSGGLDMDKNGYPDLLIGAENSDTAVLVRARPIITTTATLLYPEGVNLDNKTHVLPDRTLVTSFEITSCFSYRGKYVPDEIDVQYTLSLDDYNRGTPRALFAGGSAPGTNKEKFKITLTKGAGEETWCRASLAYVTPGIRDKLHSIPVNLVYGLDLDEALLQPYELTPVITPDPSSITTAEVNINNNCRNNVCVPDLEVLATTSASVLLVGSSQSVTLNIVVVNNGEEAFLSMFKAVVPEGLQFVGIERKQIDFSVTCSDNQEMNTIICDIGNPLMGKYQVEFGLKFSSFQLTGDMSTITFALSAISENLEASSTHLLDNFLNVTITVETKVELMLIGRSIPAEIAFSIDGVENLEIIKDTEIGPQIVHVYEVSNAGPSVAGLTTLEFTWPLYDDDGNYLLYLTNVEPSEGASCLVDGDVNPLNLTLQSVSNVSNVNSLGRSRRQVDSQHQVEQPQTLVANIDCSSSKCLTVTCDIQQLQAGKSEVIKFRARLWNNSFIETNFDRFIMSSSGVAKVINLPYAVPPIHLPEVSLKVSTIASSYEPAAKSVPIWVIILAILGGLLLLAIVIFIFWKCGFFKRKQYNKANNDEKRADL